MTVATGALGEAGAKPAVSIVVPCRNEIKCIEECLTSILAQESPPGGFEVIVADGMSEDGTREVIRRLSADDHRLVLVDNPERVTPHGMNAGIRAARGWFIAIFGAHSRYAPDYLLRCYEASERTGADNVGGGTVAEGRGYVGRAIAAARHSPFGVGGGRWHNPAYEGPADTVFGGFYRRQVFDRIGLFDESLVRNQDDEFNLRLVRAGGTIWHCPRVHSWYRPRESLRDLLGNTCSTATGKWLSSASIGSRLRRATWYRAHSWPRSYSWPASPSSGGPPSGPCSGWSRPTPWGCSWHRC